MKTAIALIALCTALLLFGCPGNGEQPTPTPSATPAPSGDLDQSDIPSPGDVDDTTDVLPTPQSPDSNGSETQGSDIGEFDLGIVEVIDDWDALELQTPSSPA